MKYELEIDSVGNLVSISQLVMPLACSEVEFLGLGILILQRTASITHSMRMQFLFNDWLSFKM